MTKPAAVKIKKAVSKKKKTAQITWKKVNGATGYEVRYSLKKNMKKSKTKSVKNVQKVTIKKLKAGKTYYIQVRAVKTESGKKSVGKWSSVKKVKVKK